MKFFACLTILVLMLAMYTHTIAQEKSRTQSDSAAVAQLVNDWAVALKTNDAKMLEHIMADDFITTNVDGSVNSK